MSYVFKQVVKLKGKYAFSNSNNEIRINADIFNALNVESQEILKEEAVLARDFYADEVAQLKSQGLKVSPSTVKNHAITKAVEAIKNKYGEDAFRAISSGVGVKSKASTKTTKAVEEPKQVVEPPIEPLVIDEDLSLFTESSYTPEPKEVPQAQELVQDLEEYSVKVDDPFSDENDTSFDDFTDDFFDSLGDEF